jgi:hypothetical protein
MLFSMKRKRVHDSYDHHNDWWIEYLLVTISLKFTVTSLLLFFNIHWINNSVAWQSIKYSRNPYHQCSHFKSETVYHAKSMHNIYFCSVTNATELRDSRVTNINQRSQQKDQEDLQSFRLPDTFTISKPTLRSKWDSNQQQRQGNRSYPKSWHCAYEQISALIDMTSCRTNENNDMNLVAPSLSMDNIVLNTLEEFVQRIYHNMKLQQKQQVQHRTHQYITDDDTSGDNDPIQAIIELLYRIQYELPSTSPTLTTIETIWSIIQCDFEHKLTIYNTTSIVSATTSNATTNNQIQPSKMMMRILQRYIKQSTQLFHLWIDWSKQDNGTLLYKRSPPIQIIIQLFTIIFHQAQSSCNNNNNNNNHQGLMSMELWNLYQSIQYTNRYQYLYDTSKNQHSVTTANRTTLNTIPSQVQLDLLLLEIVAMSGSDWDYYQCRILQQIIRSLPPKSDIRHIVQIYGIHNFDRAVIASSKTGHTADTSWLVRLLLSILPSLIHDESLLSQRITKLHMLYYESLFYSNEPGSLLYMERYLLKNNDHNNIPFNEMTCKMLLFKFSKSNHISSFSSIQFISPTLGQRAERFLYHTYRTLYHTNWYPDVECASCIIETYLPQPTIIQNISNITTLTIPLNYISRIRLADNFIRQFVLQFGLHPPLPNNTFPFATNDLTYCIFERLFDVYNDVTRHWSSTIDYDVTRTIDPIHIAEQVDTLFRFYMIQYRNGKIKTECPTLNHIQQLQCIYQNCNKTIISYAKKQSTSSSIMKQLIDNIDEYRYLLSKF